MRGGDPPLVWDGCAPADPFRNSKHSESLSVTEAVAPRILGLPMAPDLTEPQIKRIVRHRGLAELSTWPSPIANASAYQQRSRGGVLGFDEVQSKVRRNKGQDIFVPAHPLHDEFSLE